MSREERVCLGAVVGVHGIRGEVKVKSFTEIDRDLGKYGDLENEDASRRFTVKVVGHSKDLLRVKTRGVDDRNTARNPYRSWFVYQPDTAAGAGGRRVLPRRPYRFGSSEYCRR